MLVVTHKKRSKPTTVNPFYSMASVWWLDALAKGNDFGVVWTVGSLLLLLLRMYEDPLTSRLR